MRRLKLWRLKRARLICPVQAKVFGDMPISRGLADTKSGAVPRKKQFIAVFFLLLYLFFLPFLSHAGGLGIAPAAFILGLVGYGLMGRDFVAFLGNWKKQASWLAPLFLFLIWLILSAFWSPYRPDIWPMNAGKFVLGILGFLGVYFLPRFTSQIDRSYVGQAVIASSLFMAGLLVFDQLSGFALTYLFDPIGADELRDSKNGDIIMNLGHSATVLALLSSVVISLTLTLFKDKWVFLTLWLLIVGVAMWLAALAVGELALLASIPFMILGWKHPKASLRILAVLIILSLLAAPVWSYAMQFIPDHVKYALPMSWEHRIEMWSYSAVKIMEHPIIGHGFDSVRTFNETFTSPRITDWAIISLHPHNFGLQIWLETGLIGVLLACALILSLVPVLERFSLGNPYKSASLSGFLASALCISCITYGVWQEWWWGAIISISMLIAFIPANIEDDL